MHITSECDEVDEDVQPTLDEARWPAATSVLGEGADAERGSQFGPVGEGYLLGPVQAGEAVPRTTAPAAGEVPQTARQLRIM